MKTSNLTSRLLFSFVLQEHTILNVTRGLVSFECLTSGRRSLCALLHISARAGRSQYKRLAYAQSKLELCGLGGTCRQPSKETPIVISKLLFCSISGGSFYLCLPISLLPWVARSLRGQPTNPPTHPPIAFSSRHLLFHEWNWFPTNKVVTASSCDYVKGLQLGDVTVSLPRERTHVCAMKLWITIRVRCKHSLHRIMVLLGTYHVTLLSLPVWRTKQFTNCLRLLVQANEQWASGLNWPATLIVWT
jgi:hypothetical protein